MKMAPFAALAALALAGCGTASALNQQPGAAPPPPMHVTVKPSTFCRQMSKVDASTGQRKFAQSWDVNDTPETVTGVEEAGARYQASCEGEKAEAATARLPRSIK